MELDVKVKFSYIDSEDNDFCWKDQLVLSLTFKEPNKLFKTTLHEYITSYNETKEQFHQRIYNIVNDESEIKDIVMTKVRRYFNDKYAKNEEANSIRTIENFLKQKNKEGISVRVKI